MNVYIQMLSVFFLEGLPTGRAFSCAESSTYEIILTFLSLICTIRSNWLLMVVKSWFKSNDLTRIAGGIVHKR